MNLTLLTKVCSMAIAIFAVANLVWAYGVSYSPILTAEESKWRYQALQDSNRRAKPGECPTAKDLEAVPALVREHYEMAVWSAYHLRQFGGSTWVHCAPASLLLLVLSIIGYARTSRLTCLHRNRRERDARPDTPGAG